jgi:hypothetical protein
MDKKSGLIHWFDFWTEKVYYSQMGRASHRWPTSMEWMYRYCTGEIGKDHKLSIPFWTCVSTSEIYYSFIIYRQNIISFLTKELSWLLWFVDLNLNFWLKLTLHLYLSLEIQLNLDRNWMIFTSLIRTDISLERLLLFDLLLLSAILSFSRLFSFFRNSRDSFG